MFLDDHVQRSSKDSSSWLSAPQIAVQPASPMTQSPASEDEVVQEERSIDQPTSNTVVHVEDHDLEQEQVSAKISGLEILQDADLSNLNM